MYNRTPYNRAPYNRKARFVFEWTATANVESGSGGAVLIIRYLSGASEAETGSSGEVVRGRLYPYPLFCGGRRGRHDGERDGGIDLRARGFDRRGREHGRRGRAHYRHGAHDGNA